MSPTVTFDTGDFNINGGTISSSEVIANWNAIMANSTQIDTGFIVLEHDLFEQTVELATGYILPEALAHQPAFKMMPVITCLNKPLADAYIETNDNSTNPPPSVSKYQIRFNPPPLIGCFFFARLILICYFFSSRLRSRDTVIWCTWFSARDGLLVFIYVFIERYAFSSHFSTIANSDCRISSHGTQRWSFTAIKELSVSVKEKNRRKGRSFSSSTASVIVIHHHFSSVSGKFLKTLHWTV